MEDLKKAGINPITTGMGGNGASASGGGVNSAQMQSSGINPIDSIIGTVNGIQTAKKTASETKNTEANTLNTTADTLQKNIATQISKIDLMIKEKQAPYLIKQERERLDQMMKQTEHIQEQINAIKGGAGSKILGTEPGKIVKDTANAIKKHADKQQSKDVMASNAWMGYPGLF